MRDVTATCPECRFRVTCEKRDGWYLAEHVDQYAERCTASWQRVYDAGVFVRRNAKRSRAARRAAHPKQDRALRRDNRARQAEYGARNRHLRAMGYENYSVYLDSPLWRRIRALVLRDGRACFGGCGRMATQVHHGNYSRETLEGHNLTDLYPICGGCHLRIEFTGAGRKVSPSEAMRNLKKARHENVRSKRRAEDGPQAASETYEDYKRRQKLWKHPRKRGKGHKSA